MAANYLRPRHAVYLADNIAAHIACYERDELPRFAAPAQRVVQPINANNR